MVGQLDDADTDSANVVNVGSIPTLTTKRKYNFRKPRKWA